jgi:hypothetical protein
MQLGEFLMTAAHVGVRRAFRHLSAVLLALAVIR